MIIGYEAAAATVGAATGAPYIEFRGNGTRRAYVREYGCFSGAATSALSTGLGRPAASGITPATNTLGQAQDPAQGAATAQFSSSWGTAPTAPNPSMRRWDFSAAIGSAVVFTWPSDGELVIPNTGVITIVQWNHGASTGPVCDVYGVWAE